MAKEQVADPVPGNPSAADNPGQVGSVLTGDPKPAEKAAEGVVDPSAAPKQPAWMAQLPDDLKADESLTKFKTIGDLGKSYRELEGKLGKIIAVPGDGATDEDRAKYRKAIGVPDKPEDYKLDKLELPAGITIDEGRTKAILAVAHKNGVPQTAINEIYKAYMTTFAKDMVAAQKLVKITTEECTAQLREELKGKYEEAMVFKARAFAHVGKSNPTLLKAFASLMDSTGVGNHPLMVKVFSLFGSQISEHGFVDSTAGNPQERGKFGHRTDAELAEALFPKK